MRKIRYKLYRLRWWLAKYRVPKYPIHLDFEVSSFCNLKCTFCPHSEKNPDFKKQFMSFSMYKKCIDEVKGKVSSIKLNLRGESTLHPEFDRFLKYANKKFIDIRLNTNGQYKNQAITFWMVKYCDNISFSVDAFYTKTYNRIRKGGDFKLLTRNIEDVIRFTKKHKKKPIITLSFVVTAENKDEVAVFKAYWKARYSKIKFFIRPAMERNYETSPSTDGYLQIGDKIAQGRKNCYMPARRLVIAANGDVYPCCVQWHKPFICIGNVLKESIVGLWDWEKLKMLRYDLKHKHFSFAACKKCESSESYIWEERVRKGKNN